MKKIILTLSILLTLSSIVSYAQKYDGSVSISYVAPIGFGASISNGVSFGNDYIGLGVDAGFSFILLGARSWIAAYPDYRHDFKIGKKTNIFANIAAGPAYSDMSIIGDKDENEDPEHRPEKGLVFYGKAGLGFDWDFNDNGLGMSIGLYGNAFTPTKNLWFIPSLALTFHW